MGPPGSKKGKNWFQWLFCVIGDLAIYPKVNLAKPPKYHWNQFSTFVGGLGAHFHLNPKIHNFQMLNFLDQDFFIKLSSAPKRSLITAKPFNHLWDGLWQYILAKKSKIYQ